MSPDSAEDQERAMRRLVMDYPVQLLQQPDLLSPQTPVIATETARTDTERA